MVSVRTVFNRLPWIASRQAEEAEREAQRIAREERRARAELLTAILTIAGMKNEPDRLTLRFRNTDDVVIASFAVPASCWSQDRSSIRLPPVSFTALFATTLARYELAFDDKVVLKGSLNRLLIMAGSNVAIENLSVTLSV